MTFLHRNIYVTYTHRFRHCVKQVFSHWIDINVSPTKPHRIRFNLRDPKRKKFSNLVAFLSALTCGAVYIVCLTKFGVQSLVHYLIRTTCSKLGHSEANLLNSLLWTFWKHFSSLWMSLLFIFVQNKYVCVSLVLCMHSWLSLQSILSEQDRREEKKRGMRRQEFTRDHFRRAVVRRETGRERERDDRRQHSSVCLCSVLCKKVAVLPHSQLQHGVSLCQRSEVLKCSYLVHRLPRVWIIYVVMHDSVGRSSLSADKGI